MKNLLTGFKIDLLFLLAESLRIIFGSIFLFSGVIKLFGLSDFKTVLSKFHIINDQFIPALSISIVIAEIILAILIIFKIFIKSSLKGSLLIIVFFTAVVVAKLFEGADISCGCFGDLSKDKISYMTILRNLGLLIYAFILLIYYEANESTNSKSKKIIKVAWKNIKQLGIVVVLLFLIIQNLILSIHNVELKRRLFMLIESGTLKQGDTVKPFIAMDINGNASVIKFEGKEKNILFIIKDGCNPCKQNIQTWNDLNLKLNGKGARVIGVFIDSLNIMRDYINTNGIKFLSYSNSDHEFIKEYKLTSTPITLLVNNESRVEMVSKGILSKKEVEELNRLVKNKY